ncbi:MAG: hypothetical protein Crog4KO_36090 [Crocinitomicaceae bacterium]
MSLFVEDSLIMFVFNEWTRLDLLHQYIALKDIVFINECCEIFHEKVLQNSFKPKRSNTNLLAAAGPRTEGRLGSATSLCVVDSVFGGVSL